MDGSASKAVLSFCLYSLLIEVVWPMKPVVWVKTGLNNTEVHGGNSTVKTNISWRRTRALWKNFKKTKSRNLSKHWKTLRSCPNESVTHQHTNYWATVCVQAYDVPLLKCQIHCQWGIQTLSGTAMRTCKGAKKQMEGAVTLSFRAWKNKSSVSFSFTFWKGKTLYH